MNRIIFASLISLASLPAFATQIDYNGAAVNFSTDTTWTLDDLSTIVNSGNFSISNGAKLTLLGTTGQNLEWFSAGSIDINGSIYAPGINISLFATDSFSISGSLEANNINLWGNGSFALNSNPDATAGGVIGSSVGIGSGGSITLPSQSIQSITLTGTNEIVHAEIPQIVLTASSISVGEMVYSYGGSLNGSIVLQGPAINELTEVPLAGGAFYFLGALAPLVARRLRKRN